LTWDELLVYIAAGGVEHAVTTADVDVRRVSAAVAIGPVNAVCWCCKKGELLVELLWPPWPSLLLLEGGCVMDKAAIDKGKVMVDEEDMVAVLMR